MNQVPEDQAFIWKTTAGAIKIQTLQELLSILIDIPEEEKSSILASNSTLASNITNQQGNIMQWLERHFPDSQELIALFNNKNGRTFSQLHEELIDCLQEEIYMR